MKPWHDFQRFKLPALIVALIWLVTLPATVLADEIHRNKDNDGVPMALRLTDKPCTNASVREYLADHLLDDRRFKRSVLTWKGEDWESCYVEKDNQIFSIDSNKDPLSPPIPRGLFRDESI